MSLFRSRRTSGCAMCVCVSSLRRGRLSHVWASFRGTPSGRDATGVRHLGGLLLATLEVERFAWRTCIAEATPLPTYGRSQLCDAMRPHSTICNAMCGSIRSGLHCDRTLPTCHIVAAFNELKTVYAHSCRYEMHILRPLSCGYGDHRR